MALFPKRVDLDEASISELRDLYQSTSDELRKIVLTVAGTIVTVTSVQYARQLIQQRIDELAQQLGDWVETNVQTAYDQGKQDSIDELLFFKHPVTDAVAAAILAGSVRLDQLHSEAAGAIADDMRIRLSDAITQMGRSTNKTVGSLLRESIRDRIASADETTSVKALRKTLLQVLDDNSVYALVDRAGKRWSPEVYAEMLARTSLSQARNTAMTNSLSSQGYDLVRVSAHGAGDACREWEDAIISLNGDTPGYFTVSDAAGAGLFHVNCQHSLDPVAPSDYPPEYLPALDANSSLLDKASIDGM
jgi:hypothetical protein